MKWAAGIAILALVALLAVGTWSLFPRPEVPPWEEGTVAWGAENAVAAIVLGARLLDTLFEVLVYAMAIVGVGMTVRPLRREVLLPPAAETPVLARAADILLGPIVVFAVYIAGSGHLGPGGGFPAGAVLGSGFLLLGLAKGMDRLGREIHEPALDWVEGWDVLGLLGMSAVLLSLGLHGSWSLILANALIMVEVAIGAWLVLHHFASTRGEV